ncbi:MAG: SpoIIE family protein phosphatase [Anaerolineales bacterium]|nr:SpoIIE family protein phosphatase [Anaerolineales bacterium]
MEPLILERIRESLVQRRDNLTEWIRSIPYTKKEVLLGPVPEQAFLAHVETIDEAIQKAEQGTLGRCEVCQDSVETELLEIDYTACVCLDHFSKAEKRQLESELELAQNVQRMLLPQALPDLPGLDLAAFTRPAQLVGGDYFDFIDFKDERLGIAIADVAGHGVSAGLHMASVQSLLRVLVPGNLSPAEVARKLNRLFIHNVNYTTFVSLFIGSFDLTGKTLTYCNAGHNPPLLLQVDPDGMKESWLQPTGPAIGLVEEATFGEETVGLAMGDLLVLYTDGVTEAVNPRNEEFGVGRMQDVIRAHSQESSEELIRGIRQGLETFIEEQAPADDLTLVIGKIL